MFYHISFSLNDIKDIKLGSGRVFIPRIPNNLFMDENGQIIEDGITPRVCLCPTIYGCIIASQFSYAIKDHKINLSYINLKGYSRLTIFGVNEIQSILIPKTFDENGCNEYVVPDCDITGEVWSLKEIKLIKMYEFDWNSISSFQEENNHKDILLEQWKQEYIFSTKMKDKCDGY